MNYYAKGGEAHGIKSLAKELGMYGRNGDTMVAHINPQEAALLKSLGGSGTINPVTGLPEFWGIKIGPVGIGSKYGGVSVGNTSIGDVIDKSGVGDLIGGLGPIAPAAAVYFGGPLAAGIVGGINRDGKFNFRRALMTGALAYGAQNLAEGLGNAGSSGASGASSTGVPSIAVGDLGVPLLPVDAAATAGAGATPVGSIVYDDAGQLLTAADRAAMAPKAGIGQAFSDFGNKAANVARGAYRLSTGAPGAAEAFKASGATLTNTALPMYMGATGVMAANEAEKLNERAALAAVESEAERNAILARIEESRKRGEEAVIRNPYMFAEGGLASLDASPNVPMPFNAIRNALSTRLQNIQTDTTTPQDTSPMSVMRRALSGLATKMGDELPSTELKGGIGGLRGLIDRVTSATGAGPKEYETLAINAMKANPYQFAYGGSVDDNPGADDYNAGGIAYMAKGGLPPRFLSGGGDGMSDDIPATINGKQPARLADGEFVIPADVVSHLGNGSSKAGAKQLYSMMDKVRQARTGTKKQGKQINPNKFMPV